MIFIVHSHVYTSAHNTKWATKVLLFFELTKKFVIFFKKNVSLHVFEHFSTIRFTTRWWQLPVCGLNR